ncbi:MAG: hypothetical protein AAF680_00610 [Pseudomonadota bacterium]
MTEPIPPVAAPDQANVPVFGWVTAPLPGGIDDLSSISLNCEDEVIPGSAFLTGDALVFNPSVDLLPNAICELKSGTGELLWVVETAGINSGARILYDRDSPELLAPLPDDFFLRENPMSVTGVSPLVISPRLDDDLAQLVVDNLIAQVSESSGWSIHAPATIGIAEPFAASNLPATPSASLSVDAPIQLFELSATGVSSARRVPFTAQLRDDPNAVSPSQVTTLSVFPAEVLSERTSYALVVTRFLGSDASRPLEPSMAFESVLSEPGPQDTVNIQRARQITESALQALNQGANVELDKNDVALILRFTVRDASELTQSLEHLQTLAESFPVETLTVETVSNRLNTFQIRGTWSAPDFRDPDTGALARDSDGLPVQTGLVDVPFVLSVPSQAGSPVAGAPLIMVQHGNPGDAEQVIAVLEAYSDAAGNTLSSRGFAGIGFTDSENRENPVGGDGNPSFVTRALLALQDGRPLGDETLQSLAEQLVFIKLLKSLDTLDVLPPRNGQTGGDGVPDLDVSRLLYYGGSEGANKGFSILPFQDDLAAAVLSAGGVRIGESLATAGNINSGAYLQTLKTAGFNLPQTTAFAGAGLIQQLLDKETPASYARFYSTRIHTRPSLLIQEGLQDSFIPNASTRVTTAAISEIAQIEPAFDRVELLEIAPAPLASNVSDGSTAGLVQYVPASLIGIEASVGCEAQNEGHFCAQDGAAAVGEVISFFESVIETGNATIANVQ